MSFLDARLKVLLRNVFGSAAARFINLIITLAMVPLTINALSTADYAYFAMALSLSMLAAYADLGMGMAIVNVIAERGARPNSTKARRAVSVVWFSLIGIATIGLLLILLCAMWFYFGTETTSAHQYNSMLIAAGCVLAGLPTGLVQRVLFAEQKNIQANAWSTVARVSALAAVWLLIAFDWGNLLLLTLVVTGVPVVIGWISVFSVLLAKNNINLRPNWLHFKFDLSKHYLILGLSFLVLQTVPYVETGVDSLILGGLVDLNLIPAYDVYLKLFCYVPALISVSIFPIWPAIANAKASGDIRWVIKLRKLGCIMTIIVSIVASATLFIYSTELIQLWIKKELRIGPETLLGLSVYCVLSSVGLFQSMLLNGVGKIKEQVRIYSIYIVILIFAKLVAANYFGLVGMVWVLNILYIPRLLISEKLINSAISSN